MIEERLDRMENMLSQLIKMVGDMQEELLTLIPGAWHHLWTKWQFVHRVWTIFSCERLIVVRK